MTFGMCTVAYNLREESSKNREMCKRTETRFAQLRWLGSHFCSYLIAY
jgi:hypothetical protein